MIRWMKKGTGNRFFVVVSVAVLLSLGRLVVANPTV
jgi:hypothetical protein